MNTEEIDDLVAEILINDGGDGHCDGHDVITDFILSLMAGNGEKWANEYRDKGNS